MHNLYSDVWVDEGGVCMRVCDVCTMTCVSLSDVLAQPKSITVGGVQECSPSSRCHGQLGVWCIWG